jgi:cell division protein FtsI/penicillin-binding protein 2
LSRQKGRSAVVVAAVAVVTALVIGVAGYLLTRTTETRSRQDPDRPGVDVEDPVVVAADRFAAALESGDVDGVRVTDDTLAPSDVAEQVQFLFGGLAAAGAEGPDVTVTSVERGSGEDSDTASATARFSWTFDGERQWTYDTRWTLIEVGDPAEGPNAWRVQFDAASLVAGLADGQIVRVTKIPAQRGQIRDSTGRSLTSKGGTVTVGIRKSRADDPVATARSAAALTGVEPEELVARVEAAGPDEFVEVATLDRPTYDLIRDQIRPIPGTVFTESTPEDALPERYAAGVLGSVGPATAEVAAASGGRIQEGDIVGLSGIQAAKDAILAGTPGIRIEAVSPDGTGGSTVLHELPAEPGEDVVVTLDAAVQMAADAALANRSLPTALVAIRVSTGEVLAVSNGPAGSAAYNRAFLNRYPPGSTFKVVTALAYLQGGLGPDDVVPCPSTIVAGKRFKNAGEFALGDVPFRRAFARSCNTTFVGRSSEISSQQLSDTAALLGFRDLDAELGMDVFGQTVPVTDEPTMHAANTIGQGHVEGNALHVALMAASVANGRSLSPRLFVAPDDPVALRPELPAGPVEALREMMRAVVTDGTGSALEGVPGGSVHAKTGTAEYGNEDPPESHAWITGWQGDVAFAVVVEGGGSGGAVAGPVAADFLTRLAAG